MSKDPPTAGTTAGTDAGAISALRAVAHPVRLRILSLLTAEPMSAAEVSRTLGIAHAAASYHLRVLYDAGELVVESEEKIRGGVAKRYRYLAQEGPPSGPGATNEDRIAYARAVGREILRRQASHRRGVGYAGDLETWVDPEVWRRAVALLEEASTLLHAEARTAATPGAVHVSASVFAFEMQPGPEAGR